jgi:predicted transcriptional regulator
MMSGTKKSLHEFYETKVKDIMRTVKSVLPCIVENADVETVFSILMNNEYVWVTDGKDPKHVLGVITKSDTIALFSPPVPSLETFDKPDSRSLQFGVPLIAKEIMSKNPVTTSPEETIREVIEKMKQYKVKQLPVVDHHGTLLGDITLHQFIDKYCREQT